MTVVYIWALIAVIAQVSETDLAGDLVPFLVNDVVPEFLMHLVLFLSIQRGACIGTLGPGGLLGAI
jgi:hypothetical protein